MLAKQVKGRDFNGCLTYVLGKPGAIKIGGNMWGQDSLALSHEFSQLVYDRSHLTKRVYHCALSLPPGETVMVAGATAGVVVAALSPVTTPRTSTSRADPPRSPPPPPARALPPSAALAKHESPMATAIFDRMGI